MQIPICKGKDNSVEKNFDETAKTKAFSMLVDLVLADFSFPKSNIKIFESTWYNL